MFPPLAMLASNLEGAEISSILRPLLVSVLLSLLIFGILRALTKDSPKAALITVVLILAVFSYGHLYTSLKLAGLINPTMIRHRFLLPVIMVLLILILWWILRRDSSPSLFPALNVAALALVVMPIYQTTTFAVEAAAAKRTAEDRQDCHLTVEEGSIPPDIYLIVLDAYDRDDLLRELHGYDNSPFLESLENLGFHVAYGSLSNYGHTILTMASMLNLDYIQSASETTPEIASNPWSMVPSISRNEVRHQLECVGYEIVAFETGMYATEWRDADYYVTSEASILESLNATGRLNRFEALLVDTTIVRAILDLGTQLGLAPEIMAEGPADEHRERILFVLDQIERITDLPNPKFVFVHIISPHPPFVFGPDGEKVSLARFETDPALEKSAERLAYIDQITYLNARVLDIVRELLADSASMPLIIIQGDHGWAGQIPEDRLKILNAYHLPGGNADMIYPTISPVNSFRTIFDYYFGSDFGLLEDLSFFSEASRPVDFKRVENSWLKEQE